MKKPSFSPVVTDFLGDKELEKIITANYVKLNELCEKRIEKNDILEAENIYYFIVTGGTEAQVLDLQKIRDKKFDDKEIVLLAYASNNSLAASMELLARFNQIGKKGRIIYLPDSENLIPASANIQNLNGKGQLAGSRIGEIGSPSDWLVASSPSAETVKENWGADVIPVKMTELKQLFSEITDEDCLDNFNELTNNSEEIIEPTNKDILNNIKVYLAMKKIVKKHKLDAVTLRCFDLVLDLGTTGCFALSRLNDEGIIAGCEGDMISTIGMLLVYKKTGRIPWMANPSRLDIDNNSILIAHCTVPVSLVTNYIIRSHFESGIGVGIQGTFQCGDVTIFRIGGNDLNKIWLVNGKIVSTSKEEDLCRTQIEVKLNSEYNVADLLTNPLGNHLIIVPGNFEELPIV
ncbi:MAG: fucose isomerase [Candidatus Cloacimonetes bacterium]|jgi:L-fucose isomerase-like protein|nr:fucose isomerase [Candidatus Cloacimonadota bacterium]